MRYSVAVKFIAIALTAIALVAAFTGVLGIVQVAQLGLYTDGFDGWIQNRLEWQAYDLAEDLTDRYAVRALTNCPDALLDQLGYWYVFDASIHWTGLTEESYNFNIVDPEGETLASGKGLPDHAEPFLYQTGCSVQYPVLVTDEKTINETYGTDYLRRETVRAEIYNDKPVIIRYYESPEYKVELALEPNAAMDRSGTSLELVKLVYDQRYNLMIVLAVSLIVFSAGLVYLCCAAGKKVPQSKAIPGGLNRMPLDIYAAVGGVGGYWLGRLAAEMISYWIFTMDNLNPGTLALVGLVLLALSVIVVGFVFALAAQIKAGSFFLWKRSLIGWLWKKLVLLAKLLWKCVKSLAELLPAIWHYILAGCVMGVALIVSMLFAVRGIVIPLIVVIVICVGVVLYGAYAYGVILRGAEKMAKGDLNSKIDRRFLIGMYGKSADSLNALAQVASLAAKNQLKSERMKTELITNVSHDIKTPLTSIINYVDLLQSARDAQAQQQYLEVLGRQSQRLKKLIDDLMEMSKAASGNMTLDVMAIDPVEALNQALGEFSEKLEAQNLSVVFQKPEQTFTMAADGRLTWRVLSNLLSNVVKYAMPDTRVYVDVMQVEEQILISLKNISREALNVTAEELTERFVRGDVSRNTEGSGLGLNIAKSLMEAQKGQLQLLVDGDLFKVTLVFPEAK